MLSPYHSYLSIISGSFQASPATSSENLRPVTTVTNSNEDVFEDASPNQPSSADVKKRKKRNSVSNFTKLFGKSRSRRSIAVSDSKILEGKYAAYRI